MDALPSLLAAFASAFSQQNRLFRLHFSDTALDGELLPHTLTGTEQISATYACTLECLSHAAGIELKSLPGLGVDIAIGLNDGGERRLSGIVTQAQKLGSDGGFARYGLTIEPALAALRWRHNSRVFQDKSAVEIVALILDEHIAANPVFARHFRHRAHLTTDCPPRHYCLQHRESDLAFIERLLREEGISYAFDFVHGADAVGLHTLVLLDSGSEWPLAAQSDIRFHRAHATEADDTITAWHAQRQLVSGAVALARFDYASAQSQHGGDGTAIDHGEDGSTLAGALEDYDPLTLSTDDSHADGELDRHAQLRQQAHDLASKQFSGEGVVRGLGAGQRFRLHEHPVHDHDSEADRTFIVLSQSLQARNNLPDGFESCDEPGFHHQFTAVRATVPITPAFAHTEHDRPTARGIQTAIVVGPTGEEIHTDALGRIKVQFHWARPQDHNQSVHGASAEKNDFSSCWLRVAQPAAGDGFGHQFIPRIGQEVIVSFLENDIDRPVVVGVVHNGQHTPPAFSGAGSLPANKTLSGIKTKEYRGGGYNELLFDDTTGGIRAKLSSEHGKTQLNLDHLIHPRTQGNGEMRGEGFELRTDNAGAVRAAEGLLITTEPQPNANGKHLDRKATLDTLDAAAKLADQLGTRSDSTQHHLQQLQDAAHQLESKNNGQQPILLIHGQDSLALTTPQSLAIATGTDLDQIALADTRQTTARRWIANAAESIALITTGINNTLKQGIKLIAAKGNIQMQAQSADIEIDGDQSLTITSCKETITASAKQEITLTCGGAQIRLSGGNIEVIAPGSVSLKGAKQSATGPTSLSHAMNAMPDTPCDEEFVLRWPYDGSAVADRKFKLIRADGSTIQGKTDATGKTGLQKSLFAESVDFQLLTDD